MMPRTRCSSSSAPWLPFPHVFLPMLLFHSSLWMEVIEAQQHCPNECSCLGTFVSCYQFTEESLRNLPTNIDTLVLNGGEVRSFPPGFAMKFPQLTLLDIQSTRVENIQSSTFSGLNGLDQLAMTDCQFANIESGAFSNITALSQILFSGSEIGVIRSEAFSGLSNIGEFSIWSTKIERVESRAFSGFSDLDSFAFYMNNVSTLHRNAFVEIKNLGKVDVYMNKFFNAKGSAVMPLHAATNDMNMYANTFPCNCGVVRDFNAPLLKPYLVSQKCREDGQVFRLSDIDADQICNRQAFSSTLSSSSISTSTARPITSSPTTSFVTPSVETTTPRKVTHIIHISTSTTVSTEPTTTSKNPVSSSTSATSHSGFSTHVTEQGSTAVTQSGKGEGSGQGNNSSSVVIGSRIWVTLLVVVLPLMASLRVFP